MIGLGIIILGLLLVNLYKEKKKFSNSVADTIKQKPEMIRKDDYVADKQAN